MNREIKKIAELKIDIEDIELDGFGIDVVSFVNDPAIEVGFLHFNKETFVVPSAGETEEEFIGRCMSSLDTEFPDPDQRLAVCYSYWESDKLEDEEDKILFESYTDYPEAVKSNAERGIRLNEEVDNKCATQVGKVRAQQLAKGEPISFETVKRMYSYLSRAKEYYKPSDTEACGTISYLLWGGEEALRWSERKIRQVEEMVILQWAEEHGEEQNNDYMEVDISDKFSTVQDIAKAVAGLDILGKLGIRKDQEGVTKYKYTGPPAERGFCKALMRLNKLYSSEDMEKLKRKLSIVNPGMGPGGRNSYDVFAYKGGVNCRHYWSKNLLFKAPGSNRVLMLNQGPAEGDAGKSNNRNEPSPTGAVGNNASLKFSMIDGDKRIVAGPMMIPNKFIIRKDQNGDPYYVYFTKETIRKLQEKWSREHKWNQTDVNHDGNITDKNVLLEQWIIETPANDKSREYYGFYDLPKGTWFGAYKVNDDQTWEDIKSGKLTGFSIEGNFVEKSKENEDVGKLKQIIDILKNVNE